MTNTAFIVLIGSEEKSGPTIIGPFADHAEAEDWLEEGADPYPPYRPSVADWYGAQTGLWGGWPTAYVVSEEVVDYSPIEWDAQRGLEFDE